MHKLFEDHPGLSTMVKVGVILFIGLSVVNLIYSIKVNRALLNDKKDI